MAEVWPPWAWVTRLAALTAKQQNQASASTSKTKRIDARKFTAVRASALARFALWIEIVRNFTADFP